MRNFVIFLIFSLSVQLVLTQSEENEEGGSIEDHSEIKIGKFKYF